jgi:hypothetical protein
MVVKVKLIKMATPVPLMKLPEVPGIRQLKIQAMLLLMELLLLH